jgi:hypothetical protein
MDRQRGRDADASVFDIADPQLLSRAAAVAGRRSQVAFLLMCKYGPAGFGSNRRKTPCLMLLKL